MNTLRISKIKNGAKGTFGATHNGNPGAIHNPKLVALGTIWLTNRSDLRAAADQIIPSLHPLLLHIVETSLRSAGLPPHHRDDLAQEIELALFWRGCAMNRKRVPRNASEAIREMLAILRDHAEKRAISLWRKERRLCSFEGMCEAVASIEQSGVSARERQSLSRHTSSHRDSPSLHLDRDAWSPSDLILECDHIARVLHLNAKEYEIFSHWALTQMTQDEVAGACGCDQPKVNRVIRLVHKRASARAWQFAHLKNRTP